MRTWGDYNVMQSYEFGYRFNQVGGDIGEYRSVANFGNGLRLLGSSFSLESKDGHGHYFDELLLNTTGLGNDPYESVMLRIQKNRLYRYDMTWRSSDYFNPGLTVAGGTHLADTSRHLQDHDLTLLPQGHIQFHLGYSRNTEDRTGAFPPRRNSTPRDPLYSRLHECAAAIGTNTGSAVNASVSPVFKFTVTRRWDFFKDDTPATSGRDCRGPVPPTISTVLQQFNRSQPIHGSNPGWLGNLHTRRKLWGMNARMTYVSGKNDFALDESAQGARLQRTGRDSPDRSRRRRQPACLGGRSLAQLFPHRSAHLRQQHVHFR